MIHDATIIFSIGWQFKVLLSLKSFFSIFKILDKF